MEDFYALKIKALWTHFKQEHFAFWMICGYLFIEYVRPQSIMPSLDFLPWAKLFLIFSLVGWMTEKKRRWVSNATNKWIVIFLLVIMLASVTAVYPQVAWSHFFDYFGWLIIYFLIINIVNTEKRLFIFLFVFLLSS